MDIKDRKYSMTLNGNVQNQGFRSIVKDVAINHHLNGEVFNRPDETMIIHCGGNNGDISCFLKDLAIDAKKVDIILSIEEKVELPSGFGLPSGFYILGTDTPDDKERKFDKGMEHVRNIMVDLSAIRGDASKSSEKLWKLGSINEKLGKLDSIDEKLGKLDSVDNNISDLVSEQREHNIEQREHNARLEKILEKLAGK